MAVCAPLRLIPPHRALERSPLLAGVSLILSAHRQGSVVLDAGCGNGKYLSSASILTPRKVELDSGAWPAGKEPRALEVKMGVVDGNGKGKGKGKEFSIERVEENDGPGRLLSVGLDMCFPLLQIAAGRGHQVVRGDCFDLGCWRAGSFVSSRDGMLSKYLKLIGRYCRTTPSPLPPSTTSQPMPAEWKLSK